MNRNFAEQIKELLKQGRFGVVRNPVKRDDGGYGDYIYVQFDHVLFTDTDSQKVREAFPLGDDWADVTIVKKMGQTLDACNTRVLLYMKDSVQLQGRHFYWYQAEGNSPAERAYVEHHTELMFKANHLPVLSPEKTIQYEGKVLAHTSPCIRMLCPSDIPTFFDRDQVDKFIDDLKSMADEVFNQPLDEFPHLRSSEMGVHEKP